MTDEQINTAIAKACGWKNITRSTSNGWMHKRLIGTNEKMRVTFDVHTPIPNYCNDLNEMHEAEKLLFADDTEEDLESQYQLRLKLATGEFPWDRIGKAYRATARQRAEAFLRTLGKWEDQSGDATEMVKEVQP